MFKNAVANYVAAVVAVCTVVLVVDANADDMNDQAAHPHFWLAAFWI